MTYARPVTPELYAELISDLEDLKAHRNPWAASWLQILDTLEDEADRTAVLSALINGLPALYDQMRDLGIAALKTIARDVTFEDDLAPLQDVFVGPKPPTVPDHLGALFAPLAADELNAEPDFLELPGPNIAGPEYAPAISAEAAAELKADGPTDIEEDLEDLELRDAGIVDPISRIFDEEQAKLLEVRDELRRARAEEE